MKSRVIFDYRIIVHYLIRILTFQLKYKILYKYNIK